MKNILLIAILVPFFIGCGTTDTLNIPSENPTTQVSDTSSISQSTTKETKTPPAIPADNGTFQAIHTLIAYANKGIISDATYICVGDSTRAESNHEGQYLFYQLEDTLRTYNVTSHLLARAGHEAKQFNDEIATPTWEDVVSYIPQEGDHTIVDISLGINDYWNHHDYRIKRDLKEAILKIKAQRPKTHFVLSVPDRDYANDQMTNFLNTIYKELSHELHIPLNNLIDDLMPTKAETPYSWYRNDGFYVHLSREGQAVVAKYILNNMLP